MVKRGKWSDAELECLKDIYPKGGYWMFHSFYADRSRKAVNKCEREIPRSSEVGMRASREK
jgi:hypothetical protein